MNGISVTAAHSILVIGSANSIDTLAQMVVSTLQNVSVVAFKQQNGWRLLLIADSEMAATATLAMVESRISQGDNLSIQSGSKPLETRLYSHRTDTI